MKPELEDKWNETEATGEPVLIGDIVVCDACGGDYTHSEEPGGLILALKPKVKKGHSCE